MGASDTPVTITNQALSSIGNRSTIASLTEQSNEAIQANLHFNNVRDELLRMAPWDCAFNGNLLQFITAVPGTPQNPSSQPTQWNKTLPLPPWAYEYAYPPDCLRACYVIPQYQTGFASGVPITTAVTGGAPSFWNGPPARFRRAIDQPITVTSVGIASPGIGYAVGDSINLDQANPKPNVAVYPILTVAAVDVLGEILAANIMLSGSYLPGFLPINPVAGVSTTGSGSGASFNLTLTAPGTDQPVLLTNQEFAILAYVKQVTNVTIWDPQFVEAFLHLLGARLVYSLTGDKALANERIKHANERIIAARNTDGNEGLTVNDVTPDWIRTRGLTYPVDFGWSPNIGYDWGQLLTLY